MPYEAVNAYTVLIGEVGRTTTISVHGSAEEAWQALAETVRGLSTRWMPRSSDAAALADRWRREDPERRFWQVSAHQLQVMVPANGTTPSRSAKPAQRTAMLTSPGSWTRRWRRSSPH